MIDKYKMRMRASVWKFVLIFFLLPIFTITKISLKILFFFSLSGERAMSPAQSEDSGLAADRGTTYATISLPRENAQAMGIVFLGKSPLRL